MTFGSDANRILGPGLQVQGSIPLALNPPTCMGGHSNVLGATQRRPPPTKPTLPVEVDRVLGYQVLTYPRHRRTHNMTGGIPILIQEKVKCLRDVRHLARIITDLIQEKVICLKDVLSLVRIIMDPMLEKVMYLKELIRVGKRIRPRTIDGISSQS